MDDGNLKEAVSHLFRSDKLNKEAQTEVVLRVLYDSKNSFMIANKAGLDITPAVTLVNESRAKLREGEIEDAIALARKAADSVNSVLGTHGKARSMLLTCSRAVAAVEGIGGEVEAAQKKLDDIRGDFKCGKYESCISSSRALITEMKYSAHERAASFVGLAERASALAKDAGIRTPDSDDYIAMARDALSKDEFAKCIEYSNLSMLRSNTMLAAELEGKVRRVDRFAKDISGEMSSLSEVEKAIGSSRERNLEAVRRYAQMTEDIIGQAYNSATSYTRVTQDIVKQACQNLLESDPVPGVSQDGNCSIEGEGSGGSHAARSIEYEDQRLRIVDLYLSGKISNSELDRLLTMIDSGQSRNSLI